MRKLLYRLGVSITITGCVLYAFSCLTPFISPVDCWPMVLLGLGFPFLAISMAIMITCWMFVNWKAALGLVVLAACGLPNLLTTFACSFPSTPHTGTPALRIMQWNVRNFDNPAIHADSAGAVRRRMMDYIRKQNPGVLCLQEMVEYAGPSFLSNIDALKQLGYTYFYKPNETTHEAHYGKLYFGAALFSRYPIIDSGSVVLNDPSYPQKMIYIDINFQGKRLRVFTCHFRSFYFGANEANPPVVFHKDSSFVTTASDFEKLKRIEQEHVYQAAIARQFIGQSPYPVVFAADLNTVPSSYTYHYLNNGMQDAFLLHGNGLGGTVDGMPRTLRIDYLFAGKAFHIKNYQQHKLSLSDHYPHFMDLEWKQ